MVRREDAGDDVAAGHPPGDVVVAEVERGGAPEVAPPRGQGLRARAVAGGEVGDDGGECGVREAADEVGPGLRQLLLVPAPGAAAAASSLGRYLGFFGGQAIAINGEWGGMRGVWGNWGVLLYTH